MLNGERFAAGVECADSGVFYDTSLLPLALLLMKHHFLFPCVFPFYERHEF